MGRIQYMGSATLHPEAITRESIIDMCTWTPRRMSLAEYRKSYSASIGLNSPQEGRKDWNLAFPFRKSFTSAFEIAFTLEHIPFQTKEGVNLTFTFLKNVLKSDIKNVSTWLSSIDQAVAIRDCLDMTFALDYERELGSPENPQSLIGRLRSQAKTYGHKPSAGSMKAADALADHLIFFARAIKAYDHTDALVAVPPSSPNKPFDLPAYLAGKVAAGLGWTDLSSGVSTSSPRAQAKGLRVEDKLAAIDGTIRVDPTAFKDKVVTLLDDLYQSGTTMNYVGMLLQQAGAKVIFGLACEKTLRNDDNVQDG